MKRPQHGGNLLWAATLAGCSPDALVDFSASLNPLGPPESVYTAIAEGLDSLTTYPDPYYTSLRQALSQWHHIPPEWILPGNGAAELLTWAAWDLAQYPPIYLLTPAFADYQRGLRAFGATFQSWEWEYSPDTLYGTWKNPDRLLCSGSFLLNNPHNPTGKLFSVEKLRYLLDRLSLVVVDEAFMDFLPPEQAPSLIPYVQQYPNLVILRSLTKLYRIPGLRLGYAIAHPARLVRWQSLRDPWPVNSLAVKVAERVLQDRSFCEKTWQWLLPTRQALWEGLKALPGLTPYEGAANFLLVKTERSSLTLQEKLLKDHQILIRDCLSFPELGDRFFRVAVRTEAENQQLLKALAEIG